MLIITPIPKAQPLQRENTFGTVVITKGERSATIQVPIIGDTTFEGDETVTLLVTNIKGGKFADGATSITATGTIKTTTSNPSQLPKSTTATKSKATQQA